ncbi:MAG: Hsp70 family protein, partial [Pseudomonadales bacterium]
RAEVIRDGDGKNITPSAVYFASSDKTIVGYDALIESVANPGKVAKAFKREMGKEEAFPGFPLSPTDLSALVLKKMKAIAESQLKTVDSAVITVPANFTNGARVATITAGRMAKLPVDHIVNEPTAAALYYAYVEGVSGKIAVYDLGGGTFDISIVDVSGSDVEVLSSQGAQRLGGTDFEEKLLDLIREKYQKQAGTDYLVAESDLRNDRLEDVKIVLSRRETKIVSVEPEGRPRENVEITQAEFSAAIGTLITKAEMLFEAALDEAGLSVEDLDHVVLVGGSTRNPAVRESVKKFVGKDPVATANVDEVVALGAALYAGLKSEGDSLTAAQRSVVDKLALNEVCNHFFGTIALSHDSELQKYEDRVSILIEKNSRIPVSVTEKYFTVADGQQHVNCIVTQSVTAESDPRWVTTVKETVLGPLPADRSAGKEVRVTFSYDSNQTMKCEFLDVESGMSENVSIDLREEASIDAVSDIDRFLVE